MSDQHWIMVIGLVIAFFQGWGIYMLSVIRGDNRDIWKRLNTHGHEVKVGCEGNGCKISARVERVVISVSE